MYIHRNHEKQMIRRNVAKKPVVSSQNKVTISPPVVSNGTPVDKVALCCMAKMENLYLREWVEYHLNLGFDHIYIYDNNDPEGEKCETPITDYVQNKKVTVIDYRGKKQTSCQIQVSAYQDCYNKNSNLYKWIMFLDVDEFLVLKNAKTVKEYLSLSVFDNINIIRINWLCYSDGGHLEYEGKPVRERFTVPCKNNDVNKYYKSFVRTGIKGLKITNVHYTSDPNKGKKTLSLNNGKVIQYSASVTLPVVNHDWAYIAHYVTKSTEEFVNIKRKRRGNGSSKNRLSINFYWRYNERTPEKEQMLKKLFK